NGVRESMTLRTRMKRSGLMATAFLALTAPCQAHTETISLNPLADTSLFELTPNNNLGAAPTLVSGTNGQLAKSRALVMFDIAGHLPTNAMVMAVTLKMTVAALPGGTTSDETTFNVHRVLQPWGEGNKSGNNGSPASSGEATWNMRFVPNQPWS